LKKNSLVGGSTNTLKEQNIREEERDPGIDVPKTSQTHREGEKIGDPKVKACRARTLR